jgi:hypothetical protein
VTSCYPQECTQENDQCKVKPALELEVPVIPWAKLLCALVLTVFAIEIVDPVQYLAEDGRQWLHKVCTPINATIPES